MCAVNFLQLKVEGKLFVMVEGKSTKTEETLSW
jgi:hypothetical protein